MDSKMIPRLPPFSWRGEPPPSRLAARAGRRARESERATAAPSPMSGAAGRVRYPRPGRRSPTAAQDRAVSARVDPSGSGSPRPVSGIGAAIFPLRKRRSGAPTRPTGQHWPAFPRSSSDRPGLWREPVRRRCRSRSGSLPLHRLRVNAVVFGMCAKESDRQHTGLML